MGVGFFSANTTIKISDSGVKSLAASGTIYTVPAGRYAIMTVARANGGAGGTVSISVEDYGTIVTGAGGADNSVKFDGGLYLAAGQAVTTSQSGSTTGRSARIHVIEFQNTP